MNQNQNLYSDWSKPNFQSEWIRTPIHLDWKLIRVWIDSDLFRLQIYFWFPLIFIRIEFLDWIGLSRIYFQLIFNKQDWKLCWIGSDWFALARKQISEWFGMFLFNSEWISIQINRINYIVYTENEILKIGPSSINFHKFIIVLIPFFIIDD